MVSCLVSRVSCGATVAIAWGLGHDYRSSYMDLENGLTSTCLVVAREADRVTLVVRRGLPCFAEYVRTHSDLFS